LLLLPGRVDDEFQTLEALLHRAGRSFADVTWCGSIWSLSPTGGGVSSADSIGSSGASTVGGIISVGAGPTGSGLVASGQGLGRLVWHVTESLEEAERQLDSLRVDTFESTEETKQNAARVKTVKAAAVSPGRKRERAHPDAKGSDDLDELHPLASFPWNQKVVAVESESLALLGRKLQILLAWCNEEFKVELSCTTHARLQDEQSRLYTTF
jgi:hypothetical protein